LYVLGFEDWLLKIKDWLERAVTLSLSKGERWALSRLLAFARVLRLAQYDTAPAMVYRVPSPMTQ